MESKPPKVIKFYGQRKKYGEFSNFYPSPVEINGITYPTTEHYFQAMKFLDPIHHDEIAIAPSPGIAAKMGRDRSRPLRHDWEDVKVEIMENALISKFTQHSDLQDLLLWTGTSKLVEHTRNDSFWGDGGDGSGQNMLGICLMKVRDMLKIDPSHSVETKLLSSKNQRVPVAKDIPCVSLGDHEAAQQALNDFGVCIFSKVASDEELATGKDLFWNWIENLPLGISRNNIESLDCENWAQLGYINSGIINKYGIGQSEFMWYCRQLEGVQNVFKTIWKTDDLVTSFDGCGTFRNIWAAADDGSCRSHWLTKGGWYHLDQNANKNPGLETFQGLLNFFPASQAVGSTIVVPASHRKFMEVCANKTTRRDFVPLSSEEDFHRYCRSAVQVVLEPGDFLVWDSRLIHCSQGMDPSERCEEIAEGEPLARLVAFICMVPSNKLYLKKNLRCREIRREYVQKGLTATHNPCVMKIPEHVEYSFDYQCPPEDDPLWELVVGKPKNGLTKEQMDRKIDESEEISQGQKKARKNERRQKKRLQSDAYS